MRSEVSRHWPRRRQLAWGVGSHGVTLGGRLRLSHANDLSLSLLELSFLASAAGCWAFGLWGV